MVINPCCPKFIEVKELKSCAIIAQFSLSTKAMNPDWKKKKKLHLVSVILNPRKFPLRHPPFVPKL